MTSPTVFGIVIGVICFVLFVIVGIKIYYLYLSVQLYLKKTDPVYGCELYKDKGCSHVDGVLCDFPKCKMNEQYIRSKKNG